MKRKIITRTSIFPAAKEEVFRRLRMLSTLQYVASPFASFSPLSGNEDLIWREGVDFAFQFKLFSFIPLGIHKIHVVEFDETSCRIYTNEANTHVPVWNHHISLQSTQTGETRYTDEVEIDAGWKTLIVYSWAKCFYAHRQKNGSGFCDKPQRNRYNSEVSNI